MKLRLNSLNVRRCLLARRHQARSSFLSESQKVHDNYNAQYWSFAFRDIIFYPLFKGQKSLNVTQHSLSILTIKVIDHEEQLVLDS